MLVVRSSSSGERASKQSSDRHSRQRERQRRKSSGSESTDTEPPQPTVPIDVQRPKALKKVKATNQVLHPVQMPRFVTLVWSQVCITP